MVCVTFVHVLKKLRALLTVKRIDWFSIIAKLSSIKGHKRKKYYENYCDVFFKSVHPV